jgi:Nif-specific regulatory protein
LAEHGGKTAILIIDDDEGSCETLKDIFEEEGYSIVSALDGKSGLETIRRRRFQVALVDIKLPDIDGVHLIKLIKQKDPHLYIIMITAFATIENTIEALNRGAYSYFTKPLNIEEVKTRINKAIEHYRNDEERMRLAKEVKRREKELETISRIMSTINSSLNMRGVFQTIVTEVQKIISYDWTRVCILDEEGTDLQLFAEADGSGKVNDSPSAQRVEGAVERWVLMNREPLLLGDLTERGPFHADRDIYGRDLRSLMVIPLISRGKPFGLFYLGSKKKRSFWDEHITLFGQIAGQFALAFDNARAYESILEEKVSLEKDVVELKGKVEQKFSFKNIIVKSETMKEVMALVNRVLQSDSTVLLQGESGTGKELLAHLFHYNGPRRNRLFITVNCGAIPEHLLESELFGFERGAFTGADRSKEGLIERAHGGTFFLDEIDELPKNLQVKLLRVLQNGELRRLGEVSSRRVDVRLIAATNRDIAILVKEGQFREDLYYRLNVFPVVIPPLREREGDILPLAEHFFERYRDKAHRELRGFSPGARKTLLRYSWPGNVRELENTVEKAVHIAEGEWIETEDLGLEEVPVRAEVSQTSFSEEMEIISRNRIEMVLRKNRGNKARTARDLGIHRTQLYRYLEKYGLA